MISGFIGNFQKYPARFINSMGSQYDIGSIMQYGGFFFSKNGKPTIVEKYVEFLPLLGECTSTTYSWNWHPLELCSYKSCVGRY